MINKNESRGTANAHSLYDCKGITAMIFINNKYTIWYYRIIYQAKDRNLLGYTEKHHIIPKSLGGANEKSNISILTAREHFICHLLLTKMTSGTNKAKMIHAANSYLYWTTSNHSRDMVCNSRTVQSLKEARQQLLKTEMSDPVNILRSSNAAKELWRNSTHRTKESIRRKEQWKDPAYKQKMASRKRTLKKVSINEVVYNSLKEAAERLGLDPSTISKRCSSKHERFLHWNYI